MVAIAIDHHLNIICPSPHLFFFLVPGDRLNEGFTVFVERKIVGRMKSRDHSEFSAILGYKALHESVDHYGKEHPFTMLCPRLTGEDPDDAFSRVPYGKPRRRNPAISALYEHTGKLA